MSAVGVKRTKLRRVKIDVHDPGCVKTLRGIIAPGILGSTVMRRAKKRKNLSPARHYDQIRFRFHTAKTHRRRFHRSFCWKKCHSTGRGIRTPFGLRSSRGGGGSRPPFAARLRNSLRLRRRRSDHRRCGTIRPLVLCGATSRAGGTGALASASGTTSRKGIRTEAARRTGRRQQKLSRDRAATRSCHNVPSFGVISFSPNGPSGVAPMDRSPGIP